jgi:hypothetical protein
MRVGDMRKFIKAFKKTKLNETWTGGSKYNKKKLTEIIKPMLKDDDLDEMVGGSIWTDFVKDFSSKHGLKYACSLSKYKEPLKKAYKLFKNKKNWFEPMKIDAISGAEPEPNITFTITEPEPEPEPKKPDVSKPLPHLISKREELLLKYKIAELKDILAGYKIKGVSKMKKDDMIKAILEHEKIPEGVKWADKPYVYQSLKDAYSCLDDDGFGLKHARYALEQSRKRQEAGKGGKMERQAYGLLQNNIKRYEARIAECEALLKRDYQKEYSGSGILTGGNKWTDFVKDYAKSYNTTYGCALNDVGIKSAYKLFKDGKTWYFPKVSATIETFKISKLKEILAGYKIKGVYKMKKDDMIKAILAYENIQKEFSGGKINLSKTFKKVSKSIDKGVKKVSKSIDKGVSKVSETLDKVNPMSIALDDKKSSKLMKKLGDVTDKNILPAVVAIGKPVYDAAAMTASTALTGNPIAGKLAADALWENMVAKKGIDPREKQTNKSLGTTSSILGNILAKSGSSKAKK